MLFRPLNYLALSLVFVLFFAPVKAQTTKRINIIPQPSMVTEKPGEFMLTADTRIISDPMFAEIAELFSSQTFIKQGTSKEKDQPHQIRFNRVGTHVALSGEINGQIMSECFCKISRFHDHHLRLRE